VKLILAIIATVLLAKHRDEQANMSRRDHARERRNIARASSGQPPKKGGC
jgi:hypothetical protein